MSSLIWRYSGYVLEDEESNDSGRGGMIHLYSYNNPLIDPNPIIYWEDSFGNRQAYDRNIDFGGAFSFERANLFHQIIDYYTFTTSELEFGPICPRPPRSLVVLDDPDYCGCEESETSSSVFVTEEVTFRFDSSVWGYNDESELAFSSYEIVSESTTSITRSGDGCICPSVIIYGTRRTKYSVKYDKDGNIVQIYGPYVINTNYAYYDVGLMGGPDYFPMRSANVISYLDSPAMGLPDGEVFYRVGKITAVSNAGSGKYVLEPALVRCDIYYDGNELESIIGEDDSTDRNVYVPKGDPVNFWYGTDYDEEDYFYIQRAKSVFCGPFKFLSRPDKEGAYFELFEQDQNKIKIITEKSSAGYEVKSVIGGNTQTVFEHLVMPGSLIPRDFAYGRSIFGQQVQSPRNNGDRVAPNVFVENWRGLVDVQSKNNDYWDFSKDMSKHPGLLLMTTFADGYDISAQEVLPSQNDAYGYFRNIYNRYMSVQLLRGYAPAALIDSCIQSSEIYIIPSSMTKTVKQILERPLPGMYAWQSVQVPDPFEYVELLPASGGSYLDLTFALPFSYEKLPTYPTNGLYLRVSGDYEDLQVEVRHNLNFPNYTEWELYPLELVHNLSAKDHIAYDLFAIPASRTSPAFDEVYRVRIKNKSNVNSIRLIAVCVPLRLFV